MLKYFQGAQVLLGAQGVQDAQVVQGAQGVQGVQGAHPQIAGIVSHEGASPPPLTPHKASCSPEDHDREDYHDHEDDYDVARLPCCLMMMPMMMT